MMALEPNFTVAPATNPYRSLSTPSHQLDLSWIKLKQANQKRPKVVLPAALAAVCTTVFVIVLLNRPYAVSQGAEDFYRALLEDREVPSKVKIDNGAYGRLSQAQVKGLVEGVLRPAYRGWSAVKVKQLKTTGETQGAETLISGPSGQKKVLLQGGPSPDGPVFKLDSLLRSAWSLPAVANAKSSSRWNTIAPCLEQGLQKDRAKLESLGIKGLDFGRQGPKTWDELEVWFARRETAS